MDLGTFSLSLAVKDLDASLAFYEALGFEVTEGGHTSRNFPDTDTARWRMLRNGSTLLGLFQGMFDKNMLTFNPKDVRTIQQQLRASGIEPVSPADESTLGPAHAMLQDPDGNPVLLDQH